MNVVVEPAHADDAPAIAMILSNWIDEVPWMPRVHTHDEDRGFGAFLIERMAVIVARVNGAVSGFLAHDRPVVHALSLTPSTRGQGFGKALLDHVKADRDKVELWTFQANSGARRFYAREGFVEVERTDGTGNDEKLPDVRLVWQAGGQA